MAANSTTTVHAKGFGVTERGDSWWVEVVPAMLLLGTFVVYATFRTFEGAFYEWGPYLSPFYSPLIDPEHTWWPLSPAILILWAPAGFRATCYYYRKAYYRAFFMDPPACGVGEHCSRRYKGETGFPLILQNLHRYFLYLALLFVVLLWYDTIKAFFFEDGFGVGVGSLVFLTNIVLLSGYTFGCHSLRHLVGGKIDCFAQASSGGTRHKMWSAVSALNERHMLFAWLSLISVGLNDLYVRLVASGTISDIRLL